MWHRGRPVLCAGLLACKHIAELLLLRTFRASPEQTSQALAAAKTMCHPIPCLAPKPEIVGVDSSSHASLPGLPK